MVFKRVSIVSQAVKIIKTPIRALIKMDLAKEVLFSSPPEIRKRTPAETNKRVAIGIERLKIKKFKRLLKSSQRWQRVQLSVQGTMGSVTKPAEARAGRRKRKKERIITVREKYLIDCIITEKNNKSYNKHSTRT
jgi:hypothetical protein